MTRGDPSGTRSRTADQRPFAVRTTAGTVPHGSVPPETLPSNRFASAGLEIPHFSPYAR
jgi:hypothetical protein